jgi:radical SAM superfamily enzyme YgiQ (UPF0313 family)
MADTVVLTAFPSTRPEGLETLSAAPPSLKSYLLSRNFGQAQLQIEAFDISLRHTPQQMTERILACDPRVVGFSSYHWSHQRILEVCRLLKQRNREIVCVIGGPQVDAVSSEYLLDGTADFAVAGPGEPALEGLLRTLLSPGQQGSFETIPGLRWTDRGSLRCSPPAENFDISNLPSPWLDGSITLDPHQRYAVTIELTRGCPFRCAYCTWGNGHSVRRFAPSRIADEITHVLHRDEVARILLADFDFFAHKAEASRILELLARENVNGTWVYACVSPFTITPQLIREAAKVPELTLGLGVESTDAEVLRAVCRRPSRQILLDRIVPLLASRNGPIVCADVIVGLPAQTEETLWTTLDDCLRMRPVALHTFRLQVLPGSQIWKNAATSGIQFERSSPHNVIRTDWLDEQAIAKWHRLTTWLTVMNWDGFLRDLVFTVGEARRDQLTRPHLWAAERLAEIGDSLLRDYVSAPDYVDSVWDNETARHRKKATFDEILSWDFYVRFLQESVRELAGALPPESAAAAEAIGLDYRRVVTTCQAVPTPAIKWPGDAAGTMECVIEGEIFRTRSVWSPARPYWGPHLREPHASPLMLVRAGSATFGFDEAGDPPSGPGLTRTSVHTVLPRLVAARLRRSGIHISCPAGSGITES